MKKSKVRILRDAGTMMLVRLHRVRLLLDAAVCRELGPVGRRSLRTSAAEWASALERWPVVWIGRLRGRVPTPRTAVLLGLVGAVHHGSDIPSWRWQELRLWGSAAMELGLLDEDWRPAGISTYALRAGAISRAELGRALAVEVEKGSRAGIGPVLPCVPAAKLRAMLGVGGGW
jgi:hypothetical protein